MFILYSILLGMHMLQPWTNKSKALILYPKHKVKLQITYIPQLLIVTIEWAAGKFIVN